jgi:hypothetical protein
MVLKPSLSTIIDETDVLTSNRTKYKRNDFFEMTMIFNEKLQQFIASFKGSYNEVKEVANNTIQSPQSNRVNDNICKENS